MVRSLQNPALVGARPERYAAKGSTKGHRMKRSAFGAVLLLSWATVAHSASDKSVLDIAPTLAELGNGWTTNQIVYLIDPRCEPPERTYPGHPDPKSLLDYLRQMMESSGRTGYLRMQYGFGDLTINHGGYHVFLQRWVSPEALSGQRFQEWNRIDRPAPDVGQEAYWKDGDMYDGLVFRRDQYLVIVEFGAASDYARATRLAQVIDAKITGKHVPKASEPGLAGVKAADGIVRLFPEPGGKIRVTGENTLHSWMIRGSQIGGWIEFAPGIFDGLDQPLPGGPAAAMGEVTIPVRSLSTSAGLTEWTQQLLKNAAHPQIAFSFQKTRFQAIPGGKETVYRLHATGPLAVAGVTNDLAIPINVFPLSKQRFRLTGKTRLKMSDHSIEPPILQTSAGNVKYRDDVDVSIEMIVGPKRDGAKTD